MVGLHILHGFQQAVERAAAEIAAVERNQAALGSDQCRSDAKFSVGDARSVAFGLVQLLNVLAVLIYGLYTVTGGSSHEGRVVPVLLVNAAMLLLCSMGSAIKRRRDLDFRAWIIALAMLWWAVPWVLVKVALEMG